MKVVYFTHSLRSCWNHGNAHFLRGLLRELALRGHTVVALEREGAWSAQNLAADHGAGALDDWRESYPELEAATYGPDLPDADDVARLTDGADAVLVHEWTEPALVAALGGLRKRGARFALLFHDTHHRVVSDPDGIFGFDLDGYDGVLAFGRTVAEAYAARGWGDRAFVWHEAADARLFRPPEAETRREGVVFVGNWGDGERTAELERFLFAPAAAAGLPLDVYGVRYRGWLANRRAPEVFARHLATVHVPRRFYAEVLAGVPTIRVFEALACGIPLVSAPWDDAEGLFRPGSDYLVVEDGAAATRALRDLAADPALRASLAASGLETILARHTCAHRADELLAVLDRLSAVPPGDANRLMETA